MNQNIAFLAAQARQEISNQFGLSDAYNNLVMQRFAELIIKECANQCQEWYDEQDILKHFGMSR